MGVHIRAESNQRMPWANTVAYYPLSTDFTDKSWNGYDLTNSWGSITTQWTVSCAYYSGSTSVNSINTTAPVWATRTIACWMYLQSPTSWSAVGVWTGTYNASTGQHNAEVLGAYNSNTSLSDYHAYWVTGSTSITNQRVFLVWVVSGNDVTCYRNWTVDASGTRGYESTDSVGIKLSGRLWGSGSEYMKGYLSDVIVESTAWTATDVLNYYNQTKSKYWL